jgi:hypothetical protein
VARAGSRRLRDELLPPRGSTAERSGRQRSTDAGRACEPAAGVR